MAINEVKQTVKEILIRALGIDEEDFDVDIEYSDTIGWSSRAHMELMKEIEDAYDLTLSPYDILDLNSYKKIVAYIEDKKE